MHGIIPALAGNTMWWCSIANRRWDHPRACGEHAYKLAQEKMLQGSSPRLRGTLGSRGASRFREGIIPALAGNTLFLLC